MNHWITVAQAQTETASEVYFRKDIYLSELGRYQVMITADARYKLFINGQFVQFGPAKPTNQTFFYDVVDISDYVTVGLNHIGVMVLTYPQSGQGRMFSLNPSGHSGLWVSSDSLPEVQTDETWWAYENIDVSLVSESDVFAPLQIYEQRRGNAPLASWSTAPIDNSIWEPAVVFEHKDLSDMEERTIPFLYRKNRRFQRVHKIRQSAIAHSDWEKWLQDGRKLRLSAGSRHIIEIDAGEEMTGFLSLNLQAGKGSQIRLLQSESYVLDERTMVNGLDIPVKGNRLDAEKGHLEGFTDTYEVTGFGDDFQAECFSPYWFRTFRLIQISIEVGEEDLLLGDFTYQEVGYPLTVQTRVTTSDPSLSAIWEMSERTLRRCMHETYEDCPFYEQLQYIMDTRAQILYTYAVAADDQLARQAIKAFRESQFASGLLNAATPSHCQNIIPTFSLYYILIVLDHWRYFGDKNVVAENLLAVEKVLQYFQDSLTSSGLVGRIGGVNGQSNHWSFIDWTREWQDTSGMPQSGLTDSITIESLLYLYGLQAAICLADVVENRLLHKEWISREKRLKQCIRQHCLSATGFLKDGPNSELYSQHAQVFGILTKVLTQEEGRAALLATLEQPENYAQCSVAMSLYLFQALQAVGLYSYTDDCWEVWRAMLAHNATTCIEASSGERSECHAWGALALYELPSVILGVTPAEPGYRSIRIAPNPGYLDYAKGEVMTPVGKVSVSWTKTESGLTIDYKAPAGVTVIVENNF